MINVHQLRQWIIQPALKPIELWSQSAENLLVGTAIQESGLHWLRQNQGPALGFWEIEPKTYSWLADKIKDHEKYKSILASCNFSSLPNDPEVLIWHLRYAVIVARFRYLVVSEPLPEADDIEKIASYYVKYYNTYLGKATVEEFVQNYERNNQK
jgi:hypothetical protein